MVSWIPLSRTQLFTIRQNARKFDWENNVKARKTLPLKIECVARD
jgi:hypothetical protein